MNITDYRKFALLMRREDRTCSSYAGDDAGDLRLESGEVVLPFSRERDGKSDVISVDDSSLAWIPDNIAELRG